MVKDIWEWVIECGQNVDKMHTNGFHPKWKNPQTVGVTGMAGVAQLVELWIVIPISPSNISDLTPKTVRTIANKLL